MTLKRYKFEILQRHSLDGADVISNLTVSSRFAETRFAEIKV